MALAKTKKKKQRKKLRAGELNKSSKIRYQEISPEQIDNFKKLTNFDRKNYLDYLDPKEKTLVIGFDEVGRGCVAGPVCTGAYSSTSFYINPSDLIKEISLSSQLVSSHLMDTKLRDDYYADTLVNENNLNDDIENLEKLSSLLKLEDSKKIAKNKREKLYKALLELDSPNNHIFYSSNFESAQTIDEIGIVDSIWLSMVKNLVDILEQYLNFYNHYPQTILLLVDGPRKIKDLVASAEKVIQEKKIFDIRLVEANLDDNQQSLELESQDNTIKLKQLTIVRGDGKSSLIAAASNIAKYDRDEYMKSVDLNDYDWSQNVGYGTKKHLEKIKSNGICEQHRKSFLKAYIN